MSRISTRVSRIAAWTGWCSPCARDDRPLVLTRSGPGGFKAWLAGHGDEDRLLLLTCRVCGEWQLVPAREEDDPEIVLVDDVEDEVREAVAAVVLPAARAEEPAPEPEPVEAPAQAATVPAPRRPVPRIVTVPEPVTTPGFSPEAVAAAASVLAAARAEAAPTAPRPRPRTQPQAATAAVPALPPVVGLPAGTRQVVLAAGR